VRRLADIRRYNMAASNSGEGRLGRLLSIIEAAHELGISRSLVYELLSSGVLRSAKIHRRRLIPREALDDFVASLASKGKAT
jgi:excisionase family DNA binding protein